MSTQEALPSPGETVAITLKEKTAALCYDKILAPKFAVEDLKTIPECVACYGKSPFEEVLQKIVSDNRVAKQLLSKGQSLATRRGKDSSFLKMPHEFLDLIGIPLGLNDEQLLNEMLQILPRIKVNSKLLAGGLLRWYAKSFMTEYRVPVAVVFDSQSERDRQYKEGDREIVVATLSSLDIVDEKQLTWKQVLEFRKDKESRSKYRRLLHWLDKEMIGRSNAFIEDDIALKLENYEKALKKHDIKTKLGIISETLDWKYFTLPMAGIALEQPVLGALLGAGLVFGKLAVKIKQINLAVDDIECGPNSEIAWVYEAKKLTLDRL